MVEPLDLGKGLETIVGLLVSLVLFDGGLNLRFPGGTIKSVVLFFLSISASSTLTRSTMVAYLFISDIYAVMLPGSQQLITTELLGRTVIFLIPLFTGIYLGHRSFVKTSPESFRKFTLGLLIFLSVAIIIRSVLI